MTPTDSKITQNQGMLFSTGEDEAAMTPKAPVRTLRKAGRPTQPEEMADQAHLEAEDPGEAEVPEDQAGQGEDEGEDSDFEMKSDAPAMRFGPLAKSSAVTNLITVLVEEWGYPKEAAKALAGAVVDPASVRRQLGSLKQSTFSIDDTRVIGGSFTFLHTRVWAHAVIPDPCNFRLAEIFGSPFLGEDPSRTNHTPIEEPCVPAEFAHALTITVKSQKHLEAVASAGFGALQSSNPQVMASVPLQGVMRDTFGALVKIHHEDTKEDLWAVMTPDGSSRVTACHKELGIQTGDVLYTFRRKPDRARSLVESLRRAPETPQRELTDAVLRRNRVATLPMVVLLRFNPDGNSSQDFASGMRSLVGMLHVAPPTPWSEPASREATAIGVLGELAKFLSQEEIAFIKGTLPASEAEEAGFFKYLDQRAAYIIRMFSRPGNTHRRVYNLIGHGIKSVRAGQEEIIRRAEKARKAKATDRIHVGLELALRPIRDTGAIPVKISTSRAALERVYQHSNVRRDDWSATGDDPDTLFACAMAELAKGDVGPKSIELGVMGAFWLSLVGALARVGKDNPENDPREPGTLVAAMLSSEHGLRILHAAIEAGRSSQDTGTLTKLAIKAVDPEGHPEIRGDGEVQIITDEWIRRFMVAGEEGAAEGASEMTDPRTALYRGWGDFVAMVKALKGRFDALEQATLPNGTRIMDTDGLVPEDASMVKEILDDICDSLVIHRKTAMKRAEALVADEEA